MEFRGWISADDGEGLRLDVSHPFAQFLQVTVHGGFLDLEGDGLFASCQNKIDLASGV